MKKLGWLSLVISFALVIACTENNIEGLDDDASAAKPTMRAGAATVPGTVQPVAFPGNFVSSSIDPYVENTQICYDMLPGHEGDLVGFKISKPTGSLLGNGSVQINISPDNKYLDFISTGAKVEGFIMKGGDGYNLYDYRPYNLTADGQLHTPEYLSGKTWSVVQISHTNVCYYKVGTEGCTPGYWGRHYDRWEAPYNGGAALLFDEVFGVTYLPGVTLGQAIVNPSTNGAFAFHAVAALLNSVSSGVDYPLTTEAVIAEVQAQVAAATYDQSLLATNNELGCPLGGTAACSPKNPSACVPQ